MSENRQKKRYIPPVLDSVLLDRMVSLNSGSPTDDDPVNPGDEEPVGGGNGEDQVSSFDEKKGSQFDENPFKR
ncbi:hypothetical protein QA597_00085 [Marinilabiliaceae bacterium ANBcel2]|nr:hypothetical protein [Marinilabiliaceae bacterium ANBcel2]